MRIALIKDGVVSNVIIAESVEQATALFPDQQIVDVESQPENCQPGALFDGKDFTPVDQPIDPTAGDGDLDPKIIAAIQAAVDVRVTAAVADIQAAAVAAADGGAIKP